MRSNMHFGSRLVFDREGMLFVTLGDRFSRPAARAGPDEPLRQGGAHPPRGRAGPGNPFLDKKDALPEIWSYGHRNIQAAGLHPQTGKLWTIEHGARGGDEVNIPKPARTMAGRWITYGVDYSGANRRGHGQVGHGAAGVLLGPLHRPVGADLRDVGPLPWLKGSILTGGLRSQLVARLQLSAIA